MHKVREPRMHTDQSFCQRYGAVAVIAGGAQGIGAAYARFVAARGLDLLIVDRDEPALASLCRELEGAHNIRCTALVADLADAAIADTVAAATQEQEVGLLIYNAAIADVGPFYKAGQGMAEELAKQQVNMASPFALLYRFARPMLRRRRGGIVLMSSGSGLQGAPYYSHYAATKAYNIVLAESLWYEFKPYNVDVLACIAGMTLSPAVAAARERGEGGHSVYQTPEDVVDEAMAALGQQPSVISGQHNRDNQGILQSLPREQAVAAIARHAIDNFLGGEPPEQCLD